MGLIQVNGEMVCAPHGSRLGPLLYSIYVNNVFKVFNECDVFAFAVDLAFYFKGDDSDGLENFHLCEFNYEYIF